MASSGKRRLASPPDAERIPAAIQTALDTLDASYADSPCAIAFSGGLDSTVLLHAAISALGRARCIALHIHHGLNPRADSWLAQCGAPHRCGCMHPATARDGSGGARSALSGIGGTVRGAWRASGVARPSGGRPG